MLYDSIQLNCLLRMKKLQTSGKPQRLNRMVQRQRYGIKKSSNTKQ